MKKIKVLIVDDELAVCKSCEKVLLHRGHDVKYAVSGREAVKMLASEPFDIVFTDLKMMDMGGMEVLKSIKENHPDIIVIIITGYATVASAVETMRQGAFDYLPKPFTSGELASVLERAIDKKRLMLAGRDAELSEAKDMQISGIVGSSYKMREVFMLIQKVAPTDSTVLIMGESGTGKDLVARAIHEQSSRSSGNFVAVDSGALSSNLLASELFGHVKGAFTGAVRDKRGLFEAADKGTIFLDEIGNIDRDTQGKLLRVLQEQTFLPVGGTEPRKVDIRMIFATNQDLKKMVDDGEFREDLYYRLYVFPIILPALRERKDDIATLTYWFLRKACRKNKKKIERISDGVMEVLINYDWPGNVRQLENVIERMVVIAGGDVLEMSHLPSAVFRKGYASETNVPQTSGDLKKIKKDVRRQSVEFIEKAFVVEALEKNDWNVTRAAKSVRMKRPNFQAIMRRYSIRARDRSC